MSRSVKVYKMFFKYRSMKKFKYLTRFEKLWLFFLISISSCQATYYRRDHLHTHVMRHHPWKSFSPERLTGFKKQQEFIGATSNFVMPNSEQQQQRAAAYHHYRLNSMPTLLDSVQKNEQSLQNDINTIS